MEKIKMITCEVVAGYAQVFEPKKNLSGNLKYSMAVMVPKTGKGLTEIKKAIQKAIEKGIEKGTITKAQVSASSFKTPLRDGDEEHKNGQKGPEFKGYMFFNASSNTSIGIVNAQVQPILDQTEFYSGCVCRVDINFFAYNTGGSRGVGAGLNNVMKVRDGDRLDGGQNAEDAFQSYKTNEVSEGEDIPF